jgi:hypothetical protein
MPAMEKRKWRKVKTSEWCDLVRLSAGYGERSRRSLRRRELPDQRWRQFQAFAALGQPAPPALGLIVKKNDVHSWMEDNALDRTSTT